MEYKKNYNNDEVLFENIEFRKQENSSSDFIYVSGKIKGNWVFEGEVGLKFYFQDKRIFNDTFFNVNNFDEKTHTYIVDYIPFSFVIDNHYVNYLKNNKEDFYIQVNNNASGLKMYQKVATIKVLLDK